MLCWFHKIMISHALDGERQLHKLTEKHIRRCTTCGEFYDACLSLSEGLIREVMSLERPVSKRLSTRILTALSRGQPAIAGMVTHIQLSSEFKSEAGDSPWFYNAWYTLNYISQSDPFTEVSRDYSPASGLSARIYAGKHLTVWITCKGPHSVEVLNINGKMICSRKGSGITRYTFSRLCGPGVYLVVISTPEGTFMEKAALF